MGTKRVPALIVKQWLPEWDTVEFSKKNYRSRPPEQFFLLSLGAYDLRRLSGIQRRTITGNQARSQDLGIQRRHDLNRSKEIARYIRHGFPWSSLTEQQRKSKEYRDLKMPGWLPTAVVVNILDPASPHLETPIDEEDQISVQFGDEGAAQLEIPDTNVSGWQLSGPPPLEIIDGQHRLLAFDEEESDFDGYELPVVAFYGLDRSWQAYLFYTINIKPKRINTSLAFDLYPLLRTEEWLDRFEGHSVYRESRAQELTEALWSYPDSPWYQRINMLGEPGLKKKMVTQASWVRNLLATIVKTSEGKRVQIGGLFGAPKGNDKLAIPWNRAQQAAFLIYGWKELKDSIVQYQETNTDLAASIPDFDSNDTMLNSDMGVRGYLHILNDLCVVSSRALELKAWNLEQMAPTISDEEIAIALESVEENEIGGFVRRLAESLSSYDWRASRAEGLSEEERQAKARFRGSTGYRELRQDILFHLLQSEHEEIVEAASEVIDTLGYAR